MRLGVAHLREEAGEVGASALHPWVMVRQASKIARTRRVRSSASARRLVA